VKYYEHHLGDYAGAAGHLSMLEHGAYRLLLDRYYATEEPLPADLAAIYRVARARTADERAAVDAVLGEFFVLVDDTYRNRRADAEINRYREAQAERDAKRENEAERQRRARARRQKLFDALRAFDQVPKWDTPTADLERMLADAKAGNAPVTDLSAPVTRDSTVTAPTSHADNDTCHAPVTPLITAIHTQSHTHTQSLSVGRSVPDGESSRANAAESATDRPGPAELPLNVQAAKAMIAAGCVSTRVNASHASLEAALAAGVTPTQLAATVREGLARSPPVGDPFTWAITTAHRRLIDAGSAPVKHTAADHLQGKDYGRTNLEALPAELRPDVAA
jgi:uncharacterized protein YdaU (DUF1376 family)